MHILERTGLYRPCHHDVWFIIQCWSIWCHCRHAGSHIPSSRTWHPHKVGRRLSSHSAAGSDMDRGRLHFPNQKHWSPVEPCQDQNLCLHIGFDWNLASKSVALLAEKLKSILHLVSCWLMGEATFSASKAVSLHGKLVHVSSIFTLIHPFLHSVVHFVTSFTTPRVCLQPPIYVHANLSWINFLL